MVDGREEASPRRAAWALAVAALAAAVGCGTPAPEGDGAPGDADADGLDADGLDAGADSSADADREADAEPPRGDPTGLRPTASMAGSRTNHSATRLADGRVLVVGGESVITRNPVATVELFDPAAETWTPGPELPEPRSNHVAVLLEDGRVLVAGGGRSAPIGVPSGLDVLSSALLFDPAAGTWTPTGDLLEGRSHFQAVRLPSGRVLVAGGGAGTHEHGSTCTGVPECGPMADTLGSAELYDPATGAFSPTGALAEPRDMFTLTLLADGRALAAAGANDAEESFLTTEVYDEATGLWSPGPDLDAEDRLFHSASLLPSGRVLVGGGKKSNTRMLATVVLVDVAASTSTLTSPLAVPHTAGAFVALPSGRVLSVGGFRCPSPCEPIVEAELYDEATGLWQAISPLAAARSGHSATLLEDGRVLVAGGFGPSATLSSCEIAE